MDETTPPRSDDGDAAKDAAATTRIEDFERVASDIFWETNTDHRFTFLSEQWEERLGPRAASLFGERPWDLDAGWVTPSHKGQLRDLMTGLKHFQNMEFSVRDEQNPQRWMCVSGRPFFNLAGGFLGYRGAIRDISAARRLETDLRHTVQAQQAVALLSQTALQAPTDDSIVVRTALALVQSVAGAPAALATLSESTATIVAQSDKWSANVTPLEHLGTRIESALIVDASADPTAGLFVSPVEKSKTHSTLLVLATSAPLSASKASFVQSVAFLLATHNARQRGAKSLELRDRALAAIDEGILITDATAHDNPIVYFNEAFARTTGFSGEEILGRNPRFLQGPDIDADVLAELRAAVAEKRTFKGVLLNHKKNGEPYQNQITVSPIRTLDGETTHFVGIQSDITARLTLESNLRHAQKMQAVGQLTGGLAHDFNNLLTMIIGSAEALAEADLDEDLRTSATIALEAAERGAMLTRHLLAFSRKRPIETNYLNPNDVVLAMRPMLERTLGAEVVLNFELSPETPFVLADRAALESALLNLVLNARDAMGAGWLTIETQRRADVAPVEGLALGEYASISVIDTGPGMTPEVMARAFEPFFTTKDMGGGHGLGLAMVYGFAEQSGGGTKLISTPGGGTRVDMFLPKAQQLTQQDRLPASSAMQRADGEKILVVEDQDDVRRFVMRQISALGYTVVSARGVDEALRILSQDDQVQLLFADVVLSGGEDGVTLAKEARRSHPNLRVLFTTGQPENILERSNGHDIPLRLLKKPYRRAELVAAIRAALDED